MKTYKAFPIPSVNPTHFVVVSEDEIKDKNWCFNIKRLNIGQADYTANILKGTDWRKIIAYSRLNDSAPFYDGVDCFDYHDVLKQKFIDRFGFDINSGVLDNQDNKHIRFYWTDGYTKAKQTSPFTEEDMIGFAEWNSNNHITLCDDKWHCPSTDFFISDGKSIIKTAKELLSLYLASRTKEYSVEFEMEEVLLTDNEYESKVGILALPIQYRLKKSPTGKLIVRQWKQVKT